MRVRQILERDPEREITTVVKITDHHPKRVWMEMDEYVPTNTVKNYFREILDVLLETRRGATERVCIWVSGFFGSGKSHFIKVLGYLLENRTLQDPDGNEHQSQEFICRRLGLEGFLPHLKREFIVKVLFINLLDYDPQNPHYSTLSRLIYRHFLEQKGLSTDFWVAAWEKELQELGLWEQFRGWVQQTYRRDWERERELNAETILQHALPKLMSNRYRNEEDAANAIRESKRRYATINPSDVVRELVEEAKRLDEHNGRIVILLDEVSLYIGESVERLTDLNSIAEQVVQQGDGKVILIATAQEVLPELVSRLTKNRQILEWLRDRFRVQLGLPPTEVRQVIARRLLSKTADGVAHLRKMLQRYEGSMRTALTLESGWSEDEFIEQYPCHPYAIQLMQDIMGAMRGSIEEARRLSGSERSLLKLIHAILRGEGGLIRGADQSLGWLISFDLFYDALAPDLRAIPSVQVHALNEIARLGKINDMPIARIAKALFLLQRLGSRYPCSVENIAASLIDRMDVDIEQLRHTVREGLKKLQQEGWVVEEAGKYQLLTPAEHSLEREIHKNLPGPAELQQEAVNIMREMLRNFRYEHGQIRRPLKVALEVDGETISEAGDLKVRLFTPFATQTKENLLMESIAESKVLLWSASESPKLRQLLERAIAIRKTLEQWQTRSLTKEQEEHKGRLEREMNEAFQRGLPDLFRQSFLNGQVFVNGQESTPQGDQLETALRNSLRHIAEEVYTEFIDKRPTKDRDCAAILTWQPGTALPGIFSDLGLLTSNGRIHRDAQPLSTVMGELQRRQNLGQDRTGKALLGCFEKPPYGWDPRLVRLFTATLFKMGRIGIRYQNRDITDPTDTQAQTVFAQHREFQRATFEILPEVNWREASERTSHVFGVRGGDTFEQTAEIIRGQAQQWLEKVQMLETRSRDNVLPQKFAKICQQTAQMLQEIVRQDDLNACLRCFLKHADSLKDAMSVVRALKEFRFDEYRKMRQFAAVAADWAQVLSGDAAQRWRNFTENMGADDLIQRWGQLVDDYAFLRSRYSEDYKRRHVEFQSLLNQTLDELRHHEAFKSQPDRAEDCIRRMEQLRCEADGTPDEESFTCPNCQRSYASMTITLVKEYRHQIEVSLDELLPHAPPVETFQLQRTVQSPDEVDELASELRRYVQRTKRPVSVQIKAEPESGADEPPREGKN